MPAPYAYDPELAPFADLVPASTEEPDYRPEAAVGLRSQASEMLRSVGYDVQDLAGLVVENHAVPGFEGAPDVPVRVYRAEGVSGTAPAVLYIHGGGFIQGSIYEGPTWGAQAAQRMPLVCVDVEYRLAPEAPAPAAIEDCYAALLWMVANAATLGISAENIVVVGMSAGGGIAAGLTLMARDRGGPQIGFQILGIPELDDRLETVSMREFTDTPMWSRGQAHLSWTWYLGGEFGPGTSPYAVPARAADVSGLPPAYISVAQFDPLRDEGISYASRLLAAGIPVELHCFPGTFHGSMIATHAEVTQRQTAETEAVLSRAAGVKPF